MFFVSCSPSTWSSQSVLTAACEAGRNRGAAHLAALPGWGPSRRLLLFLLALGVPIKVIPRQDLGTESSFGSHPRKRRQGEGRGSRRKEAGTRPVYLKITHCGEGAGYLPTNPHPSLIEHLFGALRLRPATCGPSTPKWHLLLGGETQDSSPTSAPSRLSLLPPPLLTERLLYARLLLRAFPGYLT